MTSQEIPKSPERLAILEKIAQYEREGAAFVPKYKKLLRTTTVATAEDVAKVAGIDLTDKEFLRGALQTVAQQIDLVCGLLEEGKQ